MVSAMNMHLWLQVYGAEFSQSESITRLAVDFALAPARAAWHLPAPRADEHDDFLYREVEPSAGIPTRTMVDHHLDVSAVHFEPVLHGLLLFGWLFPAACFLTDTPAELIELPGWAFLRNSQLLAYRTYEEIAYLAAGAAGAPATPPLFHGTQPYRASPVPGVIAELRKMQELLEQAVSKPDDAGDYWRFDVGFTQMDMVVALEIDEILRRDVRERLIWLGDMETYDPDNGDSFEMTSSKIVTFDRGVFPALVPQSLAGLVALDFARYLRLDRGYAACQFCGVPVQLSGAQAARARRHEAVFHPECHLRHRLQYGRSYQRRRAAARRSHRPG
jgi:hypothetical protein